MAERYDYDLDETLNLYLDGRLSGEKLEAFERRVRSDPKLLRAVEFHRGLTLDFREETPTLPTGYAERARARLRADADAAGKPRRPLWFTSPASLRILATAGAMLVVALILWPVARRAISPASDAPNLPDSTDRGAGGIQEAGQPDEETLEALRSLGYISSGGRDADTTGAQPEDAVADRESDLMPRGTAKTVLGRTASAPQPAPELQKKKEAGRSADRSADLSATSRLEPEKASEAETERRPDAVARQRVARPQEELKPALSEQDTEAAGESKSFQILSVGRAPELGRDHEVITATGTWSSLFEKSGEEPPVIDFTKQRAVLLHEALGSEPPARLSIETIAVQAGMLVITCRVERLEGSADATLAPGQIVLVPAGELPIRVVILP